MPTSTLNRPLLRHDVAFLEAQDSLLVRVDGSNFVVRGSTAYRYLSALVPHLDGETRLTDIVASLPDQQAASVVSLLTALHSKGAVIDAGDPPADVPAHVLTRFAEQRSLLMHHGDTGPGLRAVLSATVLVHGADAAQADDLVEALRANGVGAWTGEVTRVPDLPAVSELSAVDVLVHLQTDDHRGDVLQAAEDAAAAGCAFLPVIRVGDQVMIGPWQRAEDGHANVASALLRLRENGIDGADEIVAAAAIGSGASRRADLLAPGAGSIAVSVAGFELFKMISGVIPAQVDQAAVFLDATTLSTTGEFVVPHPALSATSVTLPVGRSTTDDVLEAAYVRYQGLVHPHLGVMARFLDDPAPQIPVRVGVLHAPACTANPVIEFGTDTVLGCRLRALERAAGEYALAVHARSALLPAPAPATGDPRHPGRLVAAHDAFTDAPVALPRDAVLASAHARAASRHGSDSRGVRTAPTAEDAGRRAVLDVAGHWSIDRVADGRSPVCRVRTGLAASADSTVRLLLEAAAAEGLRLTLYAGLDDLPVALLHSAGDADAIACSGSDWVAAAIGGLLQVLGRHQLRSTSWDGLPSGERTVAVEDVRLAADLADAADLTVHHGHDDVQDLLAGHGSSIALVDLSTPDLTGACAVARALIYDVPTSTTHHTRGEK